MPVSKCKNGHYYDDIKYTECPHCKNPPPQKPARARVEVNPAHRGGGEKTVGYFRASRGYDPVVGWLVCTRGREAGRDYRLRAGRNFVARSITADIALMDDPGIIREDHCSIVFDPRANTFTLLAGRGDGVTVCGKRLEGKMTLSGDEIIEIGASAFVFIPYCTGGRTW